MLKDFHFVLNEKSDIKLIKLKNKLKKSISRTIVDIIEQMVPYLEKHGISFIDKKSRYKNVGKDNEYRKDIHVYMTIPLYKRLKKLHHDINYFSIAQLVRWIIETYLKNCFKLGIDECGSKIKRAKIKWELKKTKLINEGKNIMRQLSKNSFPNPISTITYDDNFSPLIIRFH